MRQQLKDGLADAQRRGDGLAVATIRLALTAIRDRERARDGDEHLSEAEIRDVLATMIAQRRQECQRCQASGHAGMLAQQEREIAILAQFLPHQMDEAETAAAVDQAIDDIGASKVTDMGRTMAHLRQRYPGQMDFARACNLVKRRLGPH